MASAPKRSPHDAAKAEVARLRAEADKNEMLAAWTGPYGGVPPWDKVKAAAFPAAFSLGLALRAAEIEVIATQSEPPTFENTVALSASTSNADCPPTRHSSCLRVLEQSSLADSTHTRSHSTVQQYESAVHTSVQQIGFSQPGS